MIAILDYGLGNLLSIKNMFKRVGIRNVIITSDAKVIEKASKIILPGVGAFDNGMKNLENHGLINVLNKKALKEKVPFLGICLGMQLMTKDSAEGKLAGLGWFDAKTKKIKLDDSSLKIPHMGWNYIESENRNEGFLKKNKNYRFYFVHSYYVECKNPKDVLYTTNYEKDFHSAIKKDNLIGVQFHPEKSLHFGMDIFESFAKL
jgi:glutamine amidotransferase